ncbi:hypothetical protein [Salirhabdus salicampi]|uniref:hypothetical protein n=1 Tax=Salirhabdus salicampi TaxID=476102 RepID=UPI0020C417A4|nr:hypothetical protein [Salirhabdus salicampi]MCP8616378.1 hypothetical protein [Salirhabdus salicampi]
MLICSTCNSDFSEIPFESVKKDYKYCCYDCIPGNEKEDFYFMDYVDIVTAYRNFDKDFKKLISYGDRVNLSNDIEFSLSNYQNIYWGDDEGEYLQKLLSKNLCKTPKTF